MTHSDIGIDSTHSLHNCHQTFNLCMDDNCGEWMESIGVASG